MAWTDDELRDAIHEAAVAEGYAISIDHLRHNDVVTSGEVTDLRHILTALGIDHQPKPELPDTPGALIRDALDQAGNSYRVMMRDGMGYWIGVTQNSRTHSVRRENITSFGGVLDLDKVRGDEGA